MSQQERVEMPVGRPVNQIYRRCGFKANGGQRPKGRCNTFRERDGAKMEYVFPLWPGFPGLHESTDPDQVGAGTLACPKHWPAAKRELRKKAQEIVEARRVSLP